MVAPRQFARNTLQGNLEEEIVEHGGVPPVKEVSRFTRRARPQPWH